MPHLPYIPTEIWENILDLLDSSSLLNFQNVCQEWYNITIQYVMSGRLKNRALVSYLLYNSTLLGNNVLQYRVEYNGRLFECSNIKITRCAKG